jgi:hypothetical protein
MPYTVHASPQIPKGTAVQAAHQTRKDAIRAAVALVAEGIQGVTITDEDGRAYHPANFTSFFNKGKSKDL